MPTRDTGKGKFQHMHLTEETAQQLIREISTIRKLFQRKKEQWVKVTYVKRVTGWNGRELRSARERGQIRFKKNKTGIWYDAASIDPIFILPPEARKVTVLKKVPLDVPPDKLK